MKREKGFSLVEIIVIIAVLGIIVAIGAIMYSAIHHNSKVKTDIRNSEQIGKAARMWLTDGDSLLLESRKNLVNDPQPYGELDDMVDYIPVDLHPVALDDTEFYLGLTTNGKVKIIVTDDANKNTDQIYQKNRGKKPGIIYIEDERIEY